MRLSKLTVLLIGIQLGALIAAIIVAYAIVTYGSQLGTNLAPCEDDAFGPQYMPPALQLWA